MATNDADGVEAVRRTTAAYDEHIEQYVRINDDRAPIREMFAAFVSRLGPDATVADVGCGPGWETEELTGRGFRAVGVDLSAVMLSVARREHPAFGYARGDMRRLPLGDASFDGVWACASLLHLRKRELRQALGEIRRILARGGVFVSSVQSGSFEGFVPPLSGGIRSPRFYAFYQPAEWRAELESVGFAVEQLTLGTGGVTSADATGWITTVARAPQ